MEKQHHWSHTVVSQHVKSSPKQLKFNSQMQKMRRNPSFITTSKKKKFLSKIKLDPIRGGKMSSAPNPESNFYVLSSLEQAQVVTSPAFPHYHFLFQTVCQLQAFPFPWLSLRQTTLVTYNNHVSFQQLLLGLLGNEIKCDILQTCLFRHTRYSIWPGLVSDKRTQVKSQ